MSKVETLTSDIYNLLLDETDHPHSNELAAEHAMRIGGEFVKACKSRTKPREKGKLWASDIGKPCMRQHWYNFNMEGTKEALDGYTKFKFLYGNILEEAALYFAREAGHSVSHLQDSVSLEVDEWAVSGRIDAVIDQSLCDVKTASTFSFNKYKKEGLNHANDTFGYLWQLGFYRAFNEIRPEPDQCGFLWIDKQNGHILYHDVTDEVPSREEIEARIRAIIEAVEESDVGRVARAYVPKPYGKSGNMSLGVECSYCPFKQECWKDSNGGKGLRTFLYSGKPVFFTEVTREPKVMELFDA